MNGRDAIQWRGAVTRVARNWTTVFARLRARHSNQLFLHRVGTNSSERQTYRMYDKGETQVGAPQVGATTSDIDPR